MAEKVYSRGALGTASYPDQPPALYNPEFVGKMWTYSHKKVNVMTIALDDPAFTTAPGATLAIAGTCLWIPFSTNQTDRVKITFNDDSQPMSFGPAAMPFIGGIPFRQVTVFVPSAVAGAVMEIAYSTDGGNGPLDEVRVA